MKLTLTVWLRCWTCRGIGEVPIAGHPFGRRTCPLCFGRGKSDYEPTNLDWLVTLAHNLAIAGGLCAAWTQGACSLFDVLEAAGVITPTSKQPELVRAEVGE